MSEKLIRLSNLSMTFEDGVTVLDGINLYINNKEFLTLLGPSGCGKTTTLRIIGGFLTPTSGDVFFNGQRINDVPSYKRKINTVFQRYALFPHLDVYDNIAFGLKIQKMSKAEIDRRVMDSLRMMRIDMYKDRYPTELSGGQQQRVAIARALALHPDILCFDEPTSALDPELTGEVLRVIRQLADEHMTMVIVTHEMQFAKELSERVIFMEKGLVCQEGTPEEVFGNPNARVKEFIGRVMQV